jgi:hypothetical protein
MAVKKDLLDTVEIIRLTWCDNDALEIFENLKKIKWKFLLEQ